MNTAELVVSALQRHFPQSVWSAAPLLTRGNQPGDQFYIRIEPNRLVEAAAFLRDDAEMRFEQLCDVTCVDYLNFPDAADRYGVIYSLLSLTHNNRIWLKVLLNDPKPAVPTLYPIWPGAEWMEREVFDMFGITFEGHPDLRRILTWDEFEAHPLRKDYPLRGKGEREQYPVVNRETA